MVCQGVGAVRGGGCSTQPYTCWDRWGADEGQRLGVGWVGLGGCLSRVHLHSRIPPASLPACLCCCCCCTVPPPHTHTHRPRTSRSASPPSAGCSSCPRAAPPTHWWWWAWTHPYARDRPTTHTCCARWVWVCLVLGARIVCCAPLWCTIVCFAPYQRGAPSTA